jgi:colanic acid biosynthesis glycosyl transferase WcaI
MRILLVGINYAPDLIGVAKYNTELCDALASAGHEVRVITAPPYYPAWNIPRAYRSWSFRSETLNGISITRAPIYVPKRPSGAKRLLHHASFAVSSAWPALHQCFRWRPDVVFSVAPSLMSAWLAARIARRSGAFSWLHVQDFEVDAAFDLGMLKNKRMRSVMLSVERKILCSFDRVSTISSQMVHLLVRKGVDSEKVREIRNWTATSRTGDQERSARFRNELGLNDSHMVGLYSGTMSNKQGLELIIEAAANLSSSEPNVQFILCGDGPHKAMLQGLAANMPNVHFLGLQAGERFAELLSAADFHLIPQKAEAADLVLPSKLGGIFASGRPVIVMANPGTGLAAEVNGAGLVIPPGNAPALAAAVSKLAHSPDLRRSLGECARNIALSRWDKSAIVDKLEENLVLLAGLRTAVHERHSAALNPDAAIKEIQS